MASAARATSATRSRVARAPARRGMAPGKSAAARSFTGPTLPRCAPSGAEVFDIRSHENRRWGRARRLFVARRRPARTAVRGSSRGRRGANGMRWCGGRRESGSGSTFGIVRAVPGSPVRRLVALVPSGVFVAGMSAACIVATGISVTRISATRIAVAGIRVAGIGVASVAATGAAVAGSLQHALADALDRDRLVRRVLETLAQLALADEAVRPVLEMVVHRLVGVGERVDAARGLGVVLGHLAAIVVELVAERVAARPAAAEDEQRDRTAQQGAHEHARQDEEP